MKKESLSNELKWKALITGEFAVVATGIITKSWEYRQYKKTAVFSKKTPCYTTSDLVNMLPRTFFQHDASHVKGRLALEYGSYKHIPQPES